MTITNTMPKAHSARDHVTERDLCAEANHRISNNLAIIASIIHLQARSFRDPKRSFSAADVQQLLEEVGHRIAMVGQFHRLLAKKMPDSEIELGEYLHDIARAAIASMSIEGAILLEPIVHDACAVHSSRALALGMIVGELVTNSVKYAHPANVRGVVQLHCKHAGDRLEIVVADDGVGFPEGFVPERDGGLGIRMIHLLAKQAGATVAFLSTELGLSVHVAVPDAYNEEGSD